MFLLDNFIRAIPRNQFMVVDLAREVLGWQPATALAEGLASTVDSFRNTGAV